MLSMTKLIYGGSIYMKKNILNEVTQLICSNPDLFKQVSEDTCNMANIKLAELSIYYEENQIMEKLANSFRDRVAMGRTPKFRGMNQFQSFNRLRNTRMYMSYNNYNAFAYNDPKQRMQKRLYEASLRDDLKSIIRGKEAYKNFMENTLGATLDSSGKYVGGRDFTEKEYNDFFGNRTHYPGLGRVASGIIKGVENKVNSFNNSIKNKNQEYLKKGKSPLPRLVIGNPWQVSAQLFSDPKDRRMERNKLSNITHNCGGGVCYHENANGSIAITIANNPLEPLKDLLNISPSDSRLLGKDNLLAHKAVVTGHEFNEALNELDFYKRNISINIEDRNKLSEKILGGSHMSGHVLGEDFITINRLYGSQAGSPIYLDRALENMPTNSYLNAINNVDRSVAAQTVGLDYSSLDGGFGNFKNLKQLQGHFNKIMRNTNEFMREISHKGLTDINKLKLAREEYLELLKRYFPNMNLLQNYSFTQPIYKELIKYLNNEYLNAANAYGPAY